MPAVTSRASNPPIAVRAAAWWHDRWPDVLVLGGGLLAGVGALLAGGDAAKDLAGAKGVASTVAWGVRLAFAGAALTLSGGVGSVRRSARVSALERDLAAAESKAEGVQADLFALTDGYLYSLIHGRLACTSTERVTIYAHDDDRNVFTLFGRAALNPELKRKGRVDYPDDQGCIARAWRDGWAFANDYPDPLQDYAGYARRALADDVPTGVVHTIRMRSRLYCGYRVTSGDGKRPLAVVVVESTTPDRYTEAELRSMFDQGGVGRYLSDLVERVAPRLPNAGVAGRAGF